jgi:hypothetical protein
MRTEDAAAQPSARRRYRLSPGAEFDRPFAECESRRTADASRLSRPFHQLEDLSPAAISGLIGSSL